MKQIVNAFVLVFLIGLLIACNAISPQNVSNDFKWKNKKFKSTIQIDFEYNPSVSNKIITEEPVFFNLSDTIDLDSIYKIEEILQKKLKKRNIVISNNNNITLSIDTLLFKEYAETAPVYSNDDVEYLQNSEKDYFTFKILGHLKINGNIIQLKSLKKHETDPRESFTISGIIVKDGINAKVNKMIENTLNEFTHKVYDELNGLINY